ncbi:MAG: sulfotransferase domain-containing protein [Pseudomonadota bacterium]
MTPGNRRTAAIYLFADLAVAARLVTGLRSGLGIGPERIGGVISADRGPMPDALCGLPRLDPQTALVTLQTQTEVLVAGAGRDDAIAGLFSAGFTHVFDGDALLERLRPGQPLGVLFPGLHLGPISRFDLSPSDNEAMRIRPTPFDAPSFPRGGLFAVNSLPKSGTIWMAALLEQMFKVRARRQIIVSHCADIESDWKKPKLVGAVAMVRDLRDVVVSWFHHLASNDEITGYGRPRYPTVERFYWEFFLGTLNASPRYYRGNLEHWLNVVAAHYVPIVRYEDLWQDAEGELGRVLSAWQIGHTANTVSDAAIACRFDNMARRPRVRGDYVSDMLQRGHLRQGVPGAWQSELPKDIARDVAVRFVGYQSRLRY